MNLVEVFVALRNVEQFVTQASEASHSVKQIGTESEVAGKKAGIGWKGLAKWAGGAAVAYGAARGIQSAVNATTDLAKSTASLQRLTGMDTVTASEWVGVMHERGISSQQTAVAIKTLSKQMEVARVGTAAESTTIKGLRAQIDQVSAAGGRKAPAELAKLSNAIAKAQGQGVKARQTLLALGVPLADIQKGNTESVLLHVATALHNMANPAERAALMVKLFGRSGVTLLPILMQGADGVRHLLEEQKKYGNYLSGKNLADTKKLIAQQREMSARWNGLKVQLGTALIPTVSALAKVLITLTRAFLPLLKHPKVMMALIIALTTAMVAYKVAVIATTIAQMGLDAALLPIIGTIGAVVIAVVALGVGFYELYKHCKVFRDIVNATFDWIKANWKLLLVIIVAPIAGAVLLVIKYWKQIKEGIAFVWNWIKANWPLLVAILIGPFAVVALEIVKHWGLIKNAAEGAIRYIEALIDRLIKKLGGIPSAVKHVISSLPGVHQVGSVVSGVGGVLGHLADGGTVQRSGRYLVGERGPEIVMLPRASQVVPLTFGNQVPAAVGAGAGGPTVIEVPVYLDRREIARAVAQVTSDKVARR